MAQQITLTTDEDLRKAILTVFKGDIRIPSGRLRVGVLNSIVHLAGSVSSRAERNVAEELAKEVPGVLGVVNRIDSPDAPSPARTVNLKFERKTIQTNKKEVKNDKIFSQMGSEIPSLDRNTHSHRNTCCLDHKSDWRPKPA